jgi:hypothetical protein
MIKSIYDTEFSSKFIISNDSNEIAIIRDEYLEIIKISDKHEF